MSSLSREVSQHLNQVPLAGPRMVLSHPCLPPTPAHLLIVNTPPHPPSFSCVPAHLPAASSISHWTQMGKTTNFKQIRPSIECCFLSLAFSILSHIDLSRVQNEICHYLLAGCSRFCTLWWLEDKSQLF